MYCPQCATQLAGAATRCHECQLDVQRISHMLRHGDAGNHHDPAHPLSAQLKRWKHQRRSLGNLIVMCSLLVGCLIPISIGLFSGLAWLGAIITGLAGLAGFLLVVGTMLLLAADGVILTTDDEQPDLHAAQAQQPAYATSR